MNLFSKRLGLILAGVVGVGAIASLAISASFALFNSQASPQTNSITAATLTATNTSTSQSCTVTNAAPGDQPSPCTYSVQVSGMDAWLLLDVSIKSTAANPGGTSGGTGTLPLFDGTANGLQVSVAGTPSSNIQNFVQRFGTGTGSTSSGTYTSDAPNQVTCTANNPSGCNGDVTSGTTETYTVDAALPSWASNVYQGGSATITLTATAVQYKNNNGPDCYGFGPPCSTGNPWIIDAAASASGSTVTLDYQGDVTWSGTPNSWFEVIDVSQSGAAQVTAPVTNVTGSGTSTVTLTLGSLTNPGNLSSSPTLHAGDYLDVVYTPGGIGGTDGRIAGPVQLSLVPVGA